MVDLEQQGGPLGKWGLHFKQGDSLSNLEKFLSQGKVVAILNRIKYGWHLFEEEMGEVKTRHRSS
jgi:hypothetical protein